MESRGGSLWIDTQPASGAFGALDGDRTVDVAVVGGGLTGLTAATLLRRAGRDVVVIEAQRVVEGTSGFTTAHVTEVPDVRYRKLVSSFGKSGARMAAQALRAALEGIAARVAAEGIACGWRRVPGYLFTEAREGVDRIRDEVDAAREAGLAPVLTSEVPLPFPVRIAARFDRQAQFHPRAYALALALALGPARVFEQTRAVDVQEGEPCRVRTERGTVTAADVILAAHAPIARASRLAMKVAAYRSYVVGAPLRGSAPDGLFWDTEDPYHYVRGHRVDGGDVILVGGEDHKVGQREDTRQPLARLEEWLGRRFAADPVRWRWSAQLFEPADGLPYSGACGDHVYVATGLSGNGIAGGTMTAMLLCDLVLGVESPVADLLDPGRLRPRASLRAIVSENLDYPAHMVGDRLRHAPALGELRPGEGRVVDVGGERLAVYRGEDGALTASSAVCTHMGCIVAWNTAERTWDCPCHGSRFEPTGEVIDGPATRALPRREIEAPGEEPAHPDEPA